MESNDSPEIPDRGETSDIPGLPSGVGHTDRNTDGQTDKVIPIPPPPPHQIFTGVSGYNNIKHSFSTPDCFPPNFQVDTDVSNLNS